MLAEKFSSYPEERIINDSGADIFVRCWRPYAQPRAIVTICHGVNSHGGQYSWAAEQLVANGFVVYALDLRGRGRSSGPRFYVDDVDEYVADLDATIKFAKSRHKTLPVFLIGHSAGGVVSSVYVLDNPTVLAGFICESFAFEVPAPDFVLSIVKGLSYFIPYAPVLRLKNEDFSRDADVVKALNSDPLTLNEKQPAKTVAALTRANQWLRLEFPQIKVPLLILHGTEDKATKPSGSQWFEQNAGSTDKTLKLYDGYYHDLLADTGREIVMNDIRQWIEKRCVT